MSAIHQALIAMLSGDTPAPELNPANLVLSMNFDDGVDGDAIFTDSSPSAHIITPTGAARKRFVAPLMDGAGYLTLDGTSYLTVDNPADFAFTSAQDYHVFLRFRTTKTTDYKVMIDYATATSGWQLYIGNSNILGVSSPQSSAGWMEKTAANITNGQIHTAEILRKSGTLSLIYDGTVLGTITDNESYAAQPSLTIGRQRYDNNYFFVGDMDTINIWRWPNA